MSPRAPLTTGLGSVFIPHILVVSISRSLYLESFSVKYIIINIIIIIIIIIIITILLLQQSS